MPSQNTRYWRFAPTNGGTEQSNNPGQVTFADDPVAKAVRELLQNSIDHPEPGIDTVTVTFSLIDLPAAAIKAAQLVQHIEAAQQLLRDENDRNADRYQRAIAVLSRKTIPTLAVTDAGTTGLAGPNWNNLIFREGQPAGRHQSAHGGSYGFGKHAPLNLSLASAALYSTRYMPNPRAGRVTKLAGRAQLISHPDPVTGAKLQAVGFYGQHRGDEYNQPLEGAEIPDELMLPEPGTGVFIIAFNESYSNWDQQVATTVVTDFFPAVHDRKLQVVINHPTKPSRTIARDTLSIEFDNLSADHESYYYYAAYRDGETDLTQPAGRLGGMGRLRLHTLVKPKAPRRLAHINRRGMFITAARNPTDNPFYPTGGLSWSPWCAVTIADDEPTDAFIRRTEPPAHNAIQYRILADPNDAAFAQAEYRHHRDQIAKLVRDRIESSHAELGYDVKELAELFPDLPDENSGAVAIPTKPMADPDSRTPPGEVWQENGAEPMPVPAPRPSPPPNPDPEPHPPPDEPPDPEPTPPRYVNQMSPGDHRAAKAAMHDVRAVSPQPGTVKVGLRLTPDLGKDGAYFAIRQAGEQYQPDEPRIGIANASSPHAAIQVSNDIVHVQGAPGDYIAITLTLTDPDAALTGFQVVQINPASPQ